METKTGYVNLFDHVYEGGLGVFWMDGQYGVVIVAIPRLRLSMPLMQDGTEHAMIVYTLMNKDGWRREDAEEIAYMILKEIADGD